MASVLIFDSDKKEYRVLLYQSRDAVAHCSEDSLEVIPCLDSKDAAAFIEQKGLLDMAFLDVTKKEGLELSKQLRRAYELSELLVIADYSVSPMEYMTPDIRAASLLLRPFTEEQSKPVLQAFFQAFYRTQNTKSDDKVLVVENRQGKVTIPYSQIYYLEVREKKVFIRLKEKEYSKYDTMENMLKDLPEHFLRCHRSFVINSDYIRMVKLSENTIYLEDNIMVPLSRSYKAEIKEHVNQLKESQARG
ncbi:MAG: LytTR family DNA-binding domain-containing protein [Lachnospiraceae bacterium]|nr:LytTR family DNA-binding domain-containing protein [Lachnospiraceae bacterium]